MEENSTLTKQELQKLEAKIKYLENINQELLSEVEVYKKSLRENYRLMNALFDNSGFGMLLLSPDGKIQRANELFCRMLGYPVSLILDRHFSELINNYSKKKTIEEFEKILRVNQESNVLRYRRKFLNSRKEPIYIDLTISVNYDLNFNARSVVVLLEDKTSLVKTAKIKSAIYNIARDTNSTRDLKAFLRTVRVNLNRIINIDNFFVALYDKETHQFNLPYYSDKKDDFLNSVSAEGSLSWYALKKNVPVLLKEEDIIELRNNNMIIPMGTIPKIWLGIPLNVNNNTIGIIGIQHYEDENIYTMADLDIFSFLAEQIANSIQKKIWEEQIAREKANFQYLFDNSPDAISLVNLDGKIIKCNDAFTKIFGYSEAECLTYYSDLIIVDEASKAEFKVFLEKTINDKQGSFFETKRKRKDGAILDVLLTSASVILEEKTQCIYLIHRDITIQKMHEKAIIDALEKAEESDKLKTSFLANLSHEVRTPLNAVVGFSGLLMSTGGDNKEQREKYIQHITNSSDVLVQLIDNIIDMSKIEAGQIEIDFTRFGINELFENLHFSFSNKITNNNLQNKIELVYNVASEENYIYSDKIKIQQIMSALLDNAIKYTPKGKIEYGYKYLSKSELELFVSDSGIGIDKANHQKIFERFVKIEENPNRIFRGTGVGLYIVKSFTELLNGETAVESEVDKGSTFKVIIPVSNAEDKSAVTSLIKNKSAYNWSSKTILIVEDIYSNYVYLEAALKKTKVKLRFAENGKRALEIFNEKEKPDLILLDLQLPDISGFDIAKAIRQHNTEVPIIVQTAYTMNSEHELAIKNGCSDFLSKPIRQNTLISTIAKYFI